MHSKWFPEIRHFSPTVPIILVGKFCIIFARTRLSLNWTRMFSINAITMLKSSFSLSFYLQAPKVIFAYQILKNLSQLPKAKNWNTKFVRIRWSNVQRRRNTICRMYSMKQYALSKRSHMWKHACVRYSKQAVVQRTVSAVSNSTMDNAWIERRLALNLATRHLDNNAPYNYHSKINMFHWIDWPVPVTVDLYIRELMNVISNK